MKNVLILLLAFSSQVFAQNSNSKECSILSAAAPLTIVNADATASSISFQSYFSMSNNKTLQVNSFGHGLYPNTTGSANSGTTSSAVSGPITITYAAPIRLVRDSFVADMSKAVEISKQYGYNSTSVYRRPIYVAAKGAYVSIYDHASGTEKIELIKKDDPANPVALGDVVVSSAALEDPRFFIVKNSLAQLEKLDIKTGLRVPYFNLLLEELLKTGTYNGIYMPDGERLLMHKPGQAAEFVLLGATKTDLTGTGNGELLVLSNGEKVFLGKGSKWQQAAGTASLQRENQIFPALIALNGVQFSLAGTGKFLLVTENASQEKYMISADKVKCDFPKYEASTNEQFVLSSLGGQKSCSGKSISVSEWDQLVGLTPDKVLSKQTVSKFEIDYLLQRFLRQESLSRSDMGFIEMVAKSSVAKEFNDLIVMNSQKQSDSVKYKSLKLLKMFSGAPVSLEGKMSNICFSDDIKSRVSASYKEIILKKLKEDKAKDAYSFNIQNLLFIKKYLGILTAEHKQDIAYDAGTLLAEATQLTDYSLQGVFFSTLDWISTQKAREVLGLKATRLTDFIPATEATYKNFILGTDDVFGEGELTTGVSRRASGGFYYLMQNDYSGNFTSAVDKTFTWSLGGEYFEADYKRTPRPLNFKMEPTAGPNKDELLDDKMLHGMVIVGSNIGGDDADFIKENYLYYLESQGFTLYEEEEIPDALAYLKDRISGKEEKLDFFLKEAHSDGDYRNLFSINKKMFKIRAEKVNGDTTEVVDFVFHDATYAPIFITNQDFASWLKTREDEKLGGQLIYLNTSCSSYLKAAAELGAAASKNLVIVASATSVYTFSFETDNSTFFLFDGILKLKDFNEIASSMQGMRGEYIFPNQKKYQEMVVSKINGGYDVVTKIFRISETGERKPFQIEQAINAGH